jgi:hypothetical protein
MIGGGTVGALLVGLPVGYLTDVGNTNSNAFVDSALVLSIFSGFTVGASYGSSYFTPTADRLNTEALAFGLGGAAVGGLLGATAMCIGRRSMTCITNVNGTVGGAIGASLGVPVGLLVGKLRGISFTHPRSPVAVVVKGKVSAPSVLR